MLKPYLVNVIFLHNIKNVPSQVCSFWFSSCLEICSRHKQTSFKKIKTAEQNKHYNQHESCMNPLNYFHKDQIIAVKEPPGPSCSRPCQIKSKGWPGTCQSEDHLWPPSRASITSGYITWGNFFINQAPTPASAKALRAQRRDKPLYTMLHSQLTTAF